MEFIKALVRFVVWGVSCVFSRRRTKLVFGAWNGDAYSDNAKYIFEHFFDVKPFRVVWIGRREIRSDMPRLPKNATFARKGSLMAYWHLLTANYWLYTHSCCDFSLLPIYGRGVLINLGHGSIGTKKLGVNVPSASSMQIEGHRFSDRINSLVHPGERFMVVGNRLLLDVFRKSYPGLEKMRELPFGSATFDFLLKNKGNEIVKGELKRRIGSEFGLPVDKRWIVYAPTFRWTRDDNFSFHNLKGSERVRLEEILNSQNAVLIEKLHPNCLRKGFGSQTDSNVLFSIRGEKAVKLDPNYLWLIGEVCISDYSAAIYLSYFSGNPVVHFAYDLDSYMNQDTGLNYSLEDIKVGPIARTTEELLNLLSVGLKRFDVDEVGKMVPILFEYEKGRTGAKIEEFLRHRL